MVFGEIVEPTSRALWDEDINEYPQPIKSVLEWDNLSDVLQAIETLVIAETHSILEIFKRCILDTTQLVCTLKNGGIEVYKVKDGFFVVTYSSSAVVVGEVTEALKPWMEISQKIYAVTSAPLASLQHNGLQDHSNSVIRYLSSRSSANGIYKKLEPPNLVTGFSASVLSFCIHFNLTCVLYVAYLDTAPLDSLSTQPLLDLLRYVGMHDIKPFEMKMKPPSNNLYM